MELGESPSLVLLESESSSALLKREVCNHTVDLPDHEDTETLSSDSQSIATVSRYFHNFEQKLHKPTQYKSSSALMYKKRMRCSYDFEGSHPHLSDGHDDSSGDGIGEGDCHREAVNTELFTTNKRVRFHLQLVSIRGGDEPSCGMDSSGSDDSDEHDPDRV
eukprot:CAMPEP_0182417092 /NCGR_PEP_ID=MMETSP1167-20130531/1506_1 /TAXON_ID=2988 /ORGANISM="Mallomonas Sp, Strain CCMP3275" /LENGTH=161 /DNA_ID=CAMNT_0024590387 /DNA_START=708 /DNA_END=1193 /DNA_ORIENTATION=-